MRFDFIRVDTLPKLAWCASLCRGQDRVTVWHGPWVETRGNWFVDGAWDGEFSKGLLADAGYLAGSGGQAFESEVVFASASNMADRIHSLRTEDRLLVSNSAAFLMAVAKDEPDPEYRFYFDDLLVYRQIGISPAPKPLRTRSGRSILLHDCCNLSVNSDLQPVRREKPPSDPPTSFSGYVDRLQGIMERVLRNAADPARAHCRYRPVATMSQGYDSNMVAVILRRLGGSEAVAFAGHEREGGFNDSGLQIGRRLGFQMTEYDPLAYRELPGLLEIEFYTAPRAMEVVYATLEPQMRGSLFFTGLIGDVVLSTDAWHGQPHCRTQDLSTAGLSMKEFRMRAGFILFPPLFADVQHVDAIRRISKSPEMKPWANGSPQYNRPIPRRVVEEAGIPRNWFGQRKLATAQFKISKPGDMSKGGREDFLRFLGERPRPSPAARWYTAARIASILPQYALGHMLPHLPRWMPFVLLHGLKRFPKWSVARSPMDYAFQWSCDRLRPRYQI